MSRHNLVAVVDLETLSKGTGAVIASIGVVIVDVGQHMGIVDEFYSRVALKQGRQCDADTMAWWDQQKAKNPEAWVEVFGSGARPSLDYVLEELSGFLGRHFDQVGPVELMGNGSEFDNVLLADAYKQWGIEQPWQFRGNQSLRTAVWMGRQLLDIDPKYDLQFEGIQHHALHDARHEAKYLLHIMGALKKAVAGEAA